MKTILNTTISDKNELTLVGIDVSLTGTGLSVFAHNRTSGSIQLKKLYLISTPPTKARFMRVDRFLRIVDAIHSILVEYGADAVSIEGYALAAKGMAAADLPELGGMLRLRLLDKGIPFIEVEPTALKKYFTFKGNAEKSLMIQAVNEFLRISVTDDNVSDAAGLGLMLCHKLSEAEYDLSVIHEELIGKSEDKKEAKRQKNLRKKYGKNIPPEKMNPKPKRVKEVPEITVIDMEF